VRTTIFMRKSPNILVLAGRCFVHLRRAHKQAPSKLLEYANAMSSSVSAADTILTIPFLTMDLPQLPAYSIPELTLLALICLLLISCSTSRVLEVALIGILIWRIQQHDTTLNNNYHTLELRYKATAQIHAELTDLYQKCEKGQKEVTKKLKQCGEKVWGNWPLRVNEAIQDIPALFKIKKTVKEVMCEEGECGVVRDDKGRAGAYEQKDGSC
jgi:hypothetical protein